MINSRHPQRQRTTLGQKQFQLFKAGKDIESIHELIRGAGAAVALNVGGRGVAFLTAFILARTMGSHLYGNFMLVFTWLGILVLPAKLGFDSAIVRYIPQYEVKKEWSALHGVLIYAFRIILSSSILVAALLSLMIWLWRDEMTLELQHAFYLGALSLPLMAILNYCRSALRGFRRITLSLSGELIIRPLMLVIAVLIFIIFAGRGPSGEAAVGLNGIALLTAAGCSIYWLRHSLPSSVGNSTPTYHLSGWFSTALPLLFLSGISILLNQTDKVMLGLMSGAEKVGIYSIAHRITTLISFGLLAVNTIAGPIIARLYASGQRAELQRTLGIAAICALLCAFPVMCLILMAAHHILLFFGQSFLLAHGALWILCIGQFVNVLAGSVTLVMSMTGHQKQAFYLMGGCALLNIIFNFLLIPSYGINGAAAATAIIMVLWNVLMLIYVKRKLHLDPTVFAWLKNFQG